MFGDLGGISDVRERSADQRMRVDDTTIICTKVQCDSMRDESTIDPIEPEAPLLRDIIVRRRLVGPIVASASETLLGDVVVPTTEPSDADANPHMDECASPSRLVSSECCQSSVAISNTGVAREGALYRPEHVSEREVTSNQCGTAPKQDELPSSQDVMLDNQTKGMFSRLWASLFRRARTPTKNDHLGRLCTTRGPTLQNL